MRQLIEKTERPFADLLGMLDIRRSDRSENGSAYGALPRSYSDIMTIKDMKYSAKRFEIAKEILEAYLEADPDNTDMLIGLAVVNYAQGLLHKAEDILERVLAYEPMNDDARVLLSIVCKEKKIV